MCVAVQDDTAREGETQDCAVLALCLERLLVLRSSWKAFWKPAACCVAPSEALMLEMKVLIFLLVSLVAGDSRLL